MPFLLNIYLIYDSFHFIVPDGHVYLKYCKLLKSLNQLAQFTHTLLMNAYLSPQKTITLEGDSNCNCNEYKSGCYL